MNTSLMPAGITEQLRESQFEDLLAFLLTDPLPPAPINRTDPQPPPPRTRQDLEAVQNRARQQASSPTPSRSNRVLRILLVAGPKDHGPDEHDYPLWLERWSRLLTLAENLNVTTSTGFPSAEQLLAADVAVFYNANPEWDLDKAALLDRFHALGRGAVYLHYAVHGGNLPEAAADRFGFAFSAGSRFRHGEVDLVFPSSDHPITRGFPTLHLLDETYWQMRPAQSPVNILATALEDGVPQPQLWTTERGNARIVASIPGHYTWTFDDPLYRLLVLRSICWAAHEQNLDRLAELSTVGARLRD